MVKVEKIKAKRYTLVNGDCLDYLSKIPDHSIDLILTDPPYNIAQYSTGNIDLPGRSALNNNLGEWDLNEIDPFAFVQEFKRILKPDGNIFVFTSYNLIGKWHAAFDSEFDTFQFFVWHKTNPAPKIFKNGFLNTYFGFFKNKIDLNDVRGVVFFRKSKKLVLYYAEDKYTVIMISEDKYDDFVDAVRSVNKGITYSSEIDGEDTPE